MGDFQRSRSKVWWSNYIDGDTEEDAAWGGPSRGSSSSPSSSHKSQDSGFSDSEASEQSKRHTDSPVQKSDDELTENQRCECPNQQSKVNVNQSEVQSLSKVESAEQPKSPVKKLKGQFLSQCSCLGENVQKGDFNSSVRSEVVNKSPECNIDVSSQLPVKKLREKFLQDCICANQTSAKNQTYVSDKTGLLSKSPLKQDNHHITQEQIHSEDNENSDHRSVSDEQECKNSATSSPDELKTRPPPSLSRSVPVPKIRTPQKNQSLNEQIPVKSPTPSPRSLKNECRIQSPVPSPRSSRNKLNFSKCNNETRCNISKSSVSQEPENLNTSQLSPKQSNENANRKDSQLSPSSVSKQTTVCEVSENQDCASGKTVCSELPQHLGSPTHTSTPKTSTPSKVLSTPTRALRSLGLGKKHGRPVNLLNNFNR